MREEQEAPPTVPHDKTDRSASEPDPETRLREGKDPGWPVPGFPGRPSAVDSPASDADAPAPG